MVGMRKWIWVLAGVLVLVLASSPVLAAGSGGQRTRDRDGLGMRAQAAVRLQAGRLALQELAGFLGMTPEEFWNALRSGKSVSQVAAEHGKTAQEVIDFLTGKVKARLDEAVAAGKITQERADQVLAAFQARLPEILDRVRNCTGYQSPTGACGGGCGGPGMRARGGQCFGGPGARAPRPARAGGS